MFFSRKIARAKWEKAKELCGNPDNIDSFPADTLTADLRTSENTLSIWCVEDLDDVVLAMMSNEQSKLETISILYFEDINELKTHDTPGNTKIEELKSKHKDIYDLNYKELGTVAKKFLKAYVNNKYKTYYKKDIQKVLNDSIRKKRVDKTIFNESIRVALN
ncbi:MAG: hypothetical protein IKZ43_07495 [Acidaminococcaceae bacterium]|nr:hypothetical protein [Acidaminococcaceae bacterium]